MAFWLMLALYIATTALSALLAKRPKGPPPSSLGDFQAPTAEEDRAIPIVFGTVLLKGPNVIWYGNLTSIKLKKSGGALAFGASTAVGYKYYLWMWMALCHGEIDELIDIQVGEISMFSKPTNVYKGQHFETVSEGLPIVNPGSTTKKTLHIDWRMMFGGEFSEGGITGVLDFYFGGEAQESNALIADKLGIAVAPAYNGLAHVIMRGSPGTYVGTSNYIKPWAFMVRRCPHNLTGISDVSNIDGDANPAEIIYECLIDSKWGIARPTILIDTPSFEDAAITLFNEGFGLSYSIDTATDLDSFLSDVLRHIDAVLFTDPVTGLWTLKLARADYDVNDLIEITDDDLIDAPQGGRPDWPETLNEVKVSFTERQRLGTVTGVVSPDRTSMNSDTGTDISLPSVTPRFNKEWALLFIFGNTVASAGDFSSVGLGGLNLFQKLLTDKTPLAPTATLSLSDDWCAALLTFLMVGDQFPEILQSKSVSGGWGGPIDNDFVSDIVKDSMLIAVGAADGTGFTPAISDSQHNQWNHAVRIESASGMLHIWTAERVPGGPDTVTLVPNGSAGGALFYIIEVQSFIK